MLESMKLGMSRNQLTSTKETADKLTVKILGNKVVTLAYLTAC